MSRPGQTLFTWVAQQVWGPASLRQRIVRRLGPLVFCAFLVFAFTVVYFVRDAEQEAWRGRQSEAARNAANTVADLVSHADEALALAAALPASDLGAGSQALSGILQANPELLELVRVDASGQVLAGTGRDTALLANPGGVADTPWFLAAREDRRYLGDLQAASSAEPYILLASPAPDGGVVAGRLTMHLLWDVVAGIHFGDSGQAYVVDAAGTILAHRRRELVQTSRSLQGRPELAALLASPGAEWYGDYVNLEGAPVVSVAARVPGTDWVVLAELAQEEAYRTSRTAAMVLGAEMVIFAVLLTAVAHRSVTALVVQPVEQLRAGAERIGQGDLDYRIDAAGPEEIDHVAAAFNDMAARLREREAQDAGHTATLAAEVAERKRVEEALRRAHEELEERVHERTAQWAEANRALQEEVAERRQAEARLDAQKRLFESLVAVARATSERPALSATLENTLQVALTLTGGETGDLVLLNEHGELVSNIVRGRHGNLPWPRDVRERVMATGLAGWVARRRQATIVYDTAQDERWLHLDNVPYVAGSALSVPIIAGTALVGVLTLVHAQPRHFTEEHLALMQAAAAQMALAMRNAQIFDAQRLTADQQSLVYRVLRAISRQFDPDAVMRRAVSAIDEFSAWPHLSLSALDDDGVHWTIRAASGLMGAEIGNRHTVSEGVIGRTFRTGESQLLRDVTADPDYLCGQSALAKSFCSELAVPVRQGDRVIGVLNLESELPDAFDAADVQTAELLADAIALALDNARLYSAAQYELAERRRAEAALREYAAELESRNQELDAFAHTVAHDLKSPMARIVGYAQMLAIDLDVAAPAALGTYVEGIEQSAFKMRSIIDDLLLLAEVRKVDVELHVLDMDAILAEAQLDVADLSASAQAEIHLPASWPPALGYTPWVEEVWVNYLSNALKYGGRPPCVEVGAAPDGEGMVRFWVRDNGPGLTEEEQAHLFIPFTRLAQGGEPGHGLGLSIVRRIVEKLGGQVAVASSGVPGAGSEFSFTLPAGTGTPPVSS